MNDQYKGTIKQSFAWWDVGGTDIPQGTFTMINEKFKAWEKRRGFANETNFIGNSIKIKSMALNSDEDTVYVVTNQG